MLTSKGEPERVERHMREGAADPAKRKCRAQGMHEHGPELDRPVEQQVPGNAFADEGVTGQAKDKELRAHKQHEVRCMARVREMPRGWASRQHVWHRSSMAEMLNR